MRLGTMRRAFIHIGGGGGEGGHGGVVERVEDEMALF